jgi:hypothetical protein
MLKVVDVGAEAAMERLGIRAERHHEHDAQAMVAVLRARRLLHQKRRHHAEQDDDGGLGLADRRPERGGIEGVHDRNRATARQRAVDDDGAAHMEQRQVHHEAIVGVDEGIGLDAHRVQVQVGREHPFGRAGGAGGVDDRLGVPRSDLARERREAPALRPQHIRRVAAQSGNRRRLETEILPADHHRVREVRPVDAREAVMERRMGDDQPAAGVVDHMREQPALVGKIDRHVDGAEIVERKPDTDGIGAVREPGEHVLALGDAEGLEADRRAHHLLAQLPISPGAAVGEPGKNPVGGLGGTPVDQRTHHARVRVRNPGVVPMPRHAFPHIEAE